MTKKYTSKFTKISLLVLTGALIIGARPAYAHAGEIQVSALDTVAGFETIVQVSALVPHEQVTLGITKPSSQYVSFVRSADGDGTIEFQLKEGHTTQAGTYEINIKPHVVRSRFDVFPGEMDASQSKLSALGSIVRARIADEFGNALSSHEVKLSSSRAQDSISPSVAVTDSRGVATFFVQSKLPGTAIVSAFDETAARNIDTKLSIAFSGTVEVIKDIGGDPDLQLLAQAAGTSPQSATSASVAKFEIANLPATVRTNEPVNVQVKAVDARGSVVTSFRGTVVFGSTDTNATVPSRYTFVSSDQGSKTFDLGVSFRTPGSHKLIVVLDGSTGVKGERTVEVTTSAALSQSASPSVRITKPAEGTYSVSTLEVAGEAAPNAKVSMYDSGQQIAEVRANTAGRFSYNTPLLKDGSHTFHVESNGVQSPPVPVTIDTTPARVEDVTLGKTKVAPGESVSITIRSDPDLGSIQATLGEYITDLKPDAAQGPGVYSGTLSAPAILGEYTVNVILTDRQGNPSPAAEVGKVKVEESLSGGANVTTFTAPTKVQNVKAVAGNGRATLTWDSADAESGLALYRIYYGIDPARLNLVATTRDSATKWTVTNLQNGTAYHFQVIGVDTQGTEGDNRSDPVSVTPSETADDSGVFTGSLADAVAGQQRYSGGGATGRSGYSPSLCFPGPCRRNVARPPRTPEDGPEVVWTIVAAALSAGIVRKYTMKKSNV